MQIERRLATLEAALVAPDEPPRYFVANPPRYTIDGVPVDAETWRMLAGDARIADYVIYVKRVSALRSL